jgi:hypothetical protein
MGFDLTLALLLSFGEVGPRRAWVIAGQEVTVAAISAELRRSLANFMKSNTSDSSIDDRIK